MWSQCRRFSSHCCWMQEGLEEMSADIWGGGGGGVSSAASPQAGLNSLLSIAEPPQSPKESGSLLMLPVPPGTPKPLISREMVLGSAPSHPIGQSLQDEAAASSRPSTELRWAHDVLTGTRTDSSTQVSVALGKITDQSQTALKIHSQIQQRQTKEMEH